MEIAEGFENQRMVVVPPPRVAAALRAPVTRRLVVTDAGYFPHARDHARVRENGIDENIVILCIAGSGWASTGADTVRVGPSSALVVPAGMPHKYGASRDAPWTIWWCHIRGSDASELISAISRPRGNVVSLRDPDRAVPFAEHILAELQRDTSPARMMSAAGSAWNLLTHIATDRILRDRGEPVERAIAFLKETFDTSLRVAELAAMVGVSSSHLSALFNRATGGGILAYQTSLRIGKARHLLDTTTMTVREVAAEVGYSDPLYFSRHFRKIQGQSPRQYRLRPTGQDSLFG
jgi:AraC-like DNA-binding protein